MDITKSDWRYSQMDRKAAFALLFRILADLAVLASVIAAAVLADHGKSWWIWGSFLLFGVMCLVTKVLVLVGLDPAGIPPTRKPRP